jgi:hypothetical protein
LVSHDLTPLAVEIWDFFFSDFSWSWQDSLRRIREMRVIVNLCGNCRLCMVFLAFDVFFVVFCVALACVIGIAVCCCLPCIIAILYAVADQVCYLSLSPSHSLHQPSIPCPALCLEAMIKAVSISHLVGSCSIELVVDVYCHNATAIILFASQSQLVISCPKLPDWCRRVQIFLLI